MVDIKLHDEKVAQPSLGLVLFTSSVQNGETLELTANCPSACLSCAVMNSLSHWPEIQRARASFNNRTTKQSPNRHTSHFATKTFLTTIYNRTLSTNTDALTMSLRKLDSLRSPASIIYLTVQKITVIKLPKTFHLRVAPQLDFGF